MRPFAGKTALPLVIAVVSGEDDDGVVGHASFFQVLSNAADDAVDAGDHAIVGAEVGGVFFRGVPAPKKADAIHRLFHELRMTLKNLRIGQARRLDRDVLV